MKMPVPKSLQPYFVPAEGAGSDTEAHGTLRCTCGSELFHVDESNRRQLVYLRCKGCGREIPLFDGEKQGWKAHTGEAPSLDRTEPRKLHKCPLCRNDHFKVTVHITSRGREAFREACVREGSPFTEEDWTEAFLSMDADLACPRCRFRKKSWLKARCG